MKIRSKENFLDFIQSERAWRRKEITGLKSLIHSSRRSNKDVLIRSGVLLLYAHWEGYIKRVCEAFFFYLNFRGLKYSELTPNFLAVGFSEELGLNFTTKNFSACSKVVSFIVDESQEQKFKVDVNSRVDTKSNLNTEVLLNLLGMVGLSHVHFENNQHHIDNRLLKYRNAIAHGERTENNPELCLSQEEFTDLHQRLDELVDHFDSLIVNHIELESYRVSSG